MYLLVGRLRRPRIGPMAPDQPCSASSVPLRCTSVVWWVSTGTIRVSRKKVVHRVSADIGAFELGEREADAALLRCGVVFAAKPHRRLADRFDHVKYEITLLLAQHIAEHPAEQADVFLEPGVLVGAVWRFVGSSKIFYGDQSKKSGCAGLSPARAKGSA